MAGNASRFGPVTLPDSRRVRMQRLHPGSQSRPAQEVVLIPIPRSGGLGSPLLSGQDLLAWTTKVVTDIFLPQ